MDIFGIVRRGLEKGHSKNNQEKRNLDWNVSYRVTVALGEAAGIQSPFFPFPPLPYIHKLPGAL